MSLIIIRIMRYLMGPIEHADVLEKGLCQFSYCYVTSIMTIYNYNVCLIIYYYQGPGDCTL